MAEKDLDNIFISATNLSKSYLYNKVNIEILKNTNFYANIGESISITGESGIGKSTFLHILGTLDKPSSGTINFSGKDVFKFNQNKLASFRNKAIGFVFQFHHLLAEFTALENVMMPGLINLQPKAIAAANAEKILIRVGLKERLYHKTSDLSGGEQQRVALARALVLKPKLLLADEPTGNLDKKNSIDIHELLMELNCELSMTMIVVTHNMELSNLMKRNITIIDGKLEEL